MIDQDPSSDRRAPREHFDVLLIGAGISGVCAGHYLRSRCPELSFAILEGRERIGGTWDLFRYPGIRSDSDMYTLGFSFRPWKGAKTIADGERIRRYVEDTAREEGLMERIRFRRRVERVAWSSEDERWTVHVRTGDGAAELYTCRFLWGCTGYYRYDEGYTPDIPGLDAFGGRVVHPQRWPEDMPLEDQRFVVIGSGATAMSLVPALAERAKEVIMLQRSPTYVISRPREDAVVRFLGAVFPERWAFRLSRWRSILLNMLLYESARRFPGPVRRLLLKGVKRALRDETMARPHFDPKYEPWDQRLCLIPDADLFEALEAGTARVVTDRIARVDAEGVVLESGARLDADVLVTATGLNLQVFGGIEVELDGERVRPSDRMMYKGCMLEGVPNFAITLGYTNVSWTIRCELTCDYVTRVLAHMRSAGTSVCRPGSPAREVEPRPLMELSSGYVQRAAAIVPKQGSEGPWRFPQNYLVDRQVVGGPVDDGALEWA